MRETSADGRARSLASFMPGDAAKDSSREVESHIGERMERVDPAADEKVALERILDHLGAPIPVCQHG